jgi:signal transduction histidine kinase
VSSGGEAFDALAMHQYDVIISDLKMPDHDGIEVLEFARQHQRDAVRVLLTGYLDERAQRALMTPDAPYKVGKPWHDEIEVVVRRGLEQRELARRLFASVEDALSLTTFDAELATTRTPLELSQVIVRRALTVEGITACGTIVRVNSAEHLFTGGAVPRTGEGWFVDLPLDIEGELRLRARGVTDSARQLVQYMAHRAQRACGILEARTCPLPELLGAGARMNQLMRQATVGALTSALLHDLASTMQTLSGALADVTAFAGTDAPELHSALAEASSAGNEAVELFVQMRKFIRDGEVQLRPVPVRRLMDVRQKATLRIPTLPEIEVNASETLFLQVLVNLLRNAAHASPPGGAVDVKVVVADAEVTFSITDDGPGVAPEIADTMFEPFASTTHEGTGLGLAISAYVMQMCGGRISYRKDAERGACFSVTLPRPLA